MNSLQSLCSFPWGYFARSFWNFRAPRAAAFWLRQDGPVSALFRGPGAPAFEPNLGEQAGVPVFSEPVAVGSLFQKEVLSRRGLSKNGRFCLILDQPDAVVSLVQTRKLSAASIEELRRLPVENILPLANPPEGYTWELLTPAFAPLPESGVLPKAVIVVGLPQQVCRWAEQWAEAADGLLLSLIPALLVEIYACSSDAPSFALVARDSASFLLLFNKGQLRLLKKLPAFGNLSPASLEMLLSEVRAECGLEDIPLRLCSSCVPQERLRAFHLQRSSGTSDCCSQGTQSVLPDPSLDPELFSRVLENVLS